MVRWAVYTETATARVLAGAKGLLPPLSFQQKVGECKASRGTSPRPFRCKGGRSVRPFTAEE